MHRVGLAHCYRLDILHVDREAGRGRIHSVTDRVVDGLRALEATIRRVAETAVRLQAQGSIGRLIECEDGNPGRIVGENPVYRIDHEHRSGMDRVCLTLSNQAPVDDVANCQ